MILSDKQIYDLCSDVSEPMIFPYVSTQVRTDEETQVNVISYGTSSYGYDVRLAPDGFKVFSPILNNEVDPKRFNAKTLIDAPLRRAEDDVSEYWLLPPHSYALGVTVETFIIPKNVLGLCVGKSTYARAGVIVNCTPLEPGWRGVLVLEFSNSSSLPVRIYANEGIAQCLFFQGDDCRTTYADRAGKYQNQAGITTAKI